MKSAVYKYAVWLLEKRDFSENELFKKLIKKYEEEESKAAVEKCVEAGYIDDERYAFRIIEKYQKRYGQRRLSDELFKRGIDRELCEQLLEDSYEAEHEHEKIKHAINQKLKGLLPSDRKEYEKTYAFLMRKGYGSDEINRAMREYKQEAEENED